MIFINYIVMCLIFGTTFLAIKIGVDTGAPPFFSAGIRFFLAGAILLLWSVWRGKARLSLLLRKEMVLTGAALTFGVFAALYWAEQYISSGVAAVLSATGPLMIILLQNRASGQKLPVSTWAGCLVGTIGVILLVVPGVTISFSIMWIVASLVLLAGEFCYSAGTVYSQRVIRRFEDTSPIALNAAQMLYGGVMLLLLSLFTESVTPASILEPKSLLSLIYLTTAGSMVAHTIFYWLVSKTNPVFPSTWLYVSPLIALVLGALLYHEPVSLLSAIGGITVMLGIVLVNLKSLKQLRGTNPVRSSTQ
ncbi:DMT family transporter [Paenibacillus sp. GCM10012307]|uniref:EamA family transporter n=1 Tax=Paenibacillus roseus TaxID=2798579 RepID=A0A934JBY7_9BACL|nr:EamA family transporter [Paenibacillus roseus]MBJ6364311.1 EamA family transporter [Paenibacillus roseus]